MIEIIALSIFGFVVGLSVSVAMFRWGYDRGRAIGIIEGRFEVMHQNAQEMQDKMREQIGCECNNNLPVFCEQCGMEYITINWDNPNRTCVRCRKIGFGTFATDAVSAASYSPAETGR